MAGIVYATVLDAYSLNNINVRYFVIQGTCIMHIFVSYKEKLYFNQLLSLL